jgi:hypothetical protein
MSQHELKRNNTESGNIYDIDWEIDAQRDNDNRFLFEFDREYQLNVHFISTDRIKTANLENMRPIHITVVPNSFSEERIYTQIELTSTEPNERSTSTIPFMFKKEEYPGVEYFDECLRFMITFDARRHIRGTILEYTLIPSTSDANK